MPSANVALSDRVSIVKGRFSCSRFGLFGVALAEPAGPIGFIDGFGMLQFAVRVQSARQIALSPLGGQVRKNVIKNFKRDG